MKIQSIIATPVSIPTVRPCAWAWGCTLGTTRTILQMQTDDGLEGIGECSGAAPALLISNSLASQLLGHEVGDLAGLRQLCRMDFSDCLSLATPDLVEAFAALEMAMWDLQGKSLGKPLYELLGGAARPMAEFVSYGYLLDLNSQGISESDVPCAMAECARRGLAASGARMFEFKVGRYSLATDIETVREIRAVVGDSVELAVDANMKLDLPRARRFLDSVRPQRLAGFEEPVASYVEMSQLHKEFGILISGHSLDAEKRMHFPDVAGVVGDLHLQGGLSNTPRQAATFASLGLKYWQRACLETGISWSAMVHLGMACPHMGRASQALMDYIEDDLVVGEPWQVKRGGVVAPPLPGLGVSLDLEALVKYHELYLQRGVFSHFDLP